MNSSKSPVREIECICIRYFSYLRICLVFVFPGLFVLPSFDLSAAPLMIDFVGF